jgi:hypothetical protein
MNSLPTSVAKSQLDWIQPLVKGLITIFVAAVGMFMFAVVGSLAYPMSAVGAVVGAVSGLLLCGMLGVCITGLWREVPVFKDTKTFGANTFLPHALAVQIGSHGAFDMIVSVHEAVGVEVQGLLPWSSSNIFVEIECGNNPVKRTCVRHDAKFNEQFKIQIEPADETILVRLKDQDVFGTFSVGYASINISRDIIEKGFPDRGEFPISAGEHDRLRFGKHKAIIILSFHASEYFQAVPVDATQKMATRTEIDRQWASKNYGAVSFLKKVEFNPSAKIAKEAEEDPFRTKPLASRG